MKSFLRFTLVLGLVNLVAASVLASVYFITKPKIEMQEAMVKENALKQVIPLTVGNRVEPVEEDGAVKYWEVFKGSSSRVQGYVFIAKKYGYSSVIETMVGIKKDGTITGVRMLSQNETPGLGAKITEVVSDKTILKALKQFFSKERKVEKEGTPYFTEQFNGCNIYKLEFCEDAGVHAISGATISSKAVLDSIREKGLEIIGNN